jgi:CheY-like chemotaxis protein
MEMPIMPGWVTARELKMPGSTTATIPIIAVTAHTTPDDEEATRNVGCDDFTAKPIDVDQLFEAVDRVLS